MPKLVPLHMPDFMYLYTKHSFLIRGCDASAWHLRHILPFLICGKAPWWIDLSGTIDMQQVLEARGKWVESMSGACDKCVGSAWEMCAECVESLWEVLGKCVGSARKASRLSGPSPLSKSRPPVKMGFPKAPRKTREKTARTFCLNSSTTSPMPSPYP